MKRMFPEDSPWWSTAQVAQYLCCTKRAVIDLANSGNIPAPIKVSEKHWLWNKDLIRKQFEGCFGSQTNGTGINNNTPEGGN